MVVLAALIHGNNTFAASGVGSSADFAKNSEDFQEIAVFLDGSRFGANEGGRIAIQAERKRPVSPKK